MSKPYRIHTSVDISFAHHIRGHLGPCINVHGHTWKFEVGLCASELDANGFVIDFDDLDARILTPCFKMFDHSLAVGEPTYADIAGQLEELGKQLVASREAVHGKVAPSCPNEVIRLNGAENRYPGGLKIAVFPFSPTSERIAEWLYGAADEQLSDERVAVEYARIYETLRPVESVAEYRP